MHAPLVAAEKPAVPKYRTITLTNRAPIRIDEAKWPVIAQGLRGEDHPAGFYEWEMSIRVRQEAFQKHPQLNRTSGGRCIIHAKYHWWEEDEGNAFSHTGSQTVRVGRLLTQHESAADLWKHIAAVGEELRERIDNKHMLKHVTEVVDLCFAALPAHDNW